MNVEPGTRVLITQGVSSVEERLGFSLKNIEATYEGELPLEIIIYAGSERNINAVDYSAEALAELRAKGFVDLGDVRQPVIEFFKEYFGENWSSDVFDFWRFTLDALDRKFPRNYVIMTNPSLLLDSGERVRGIECWWTPIEK